VTKDTEVQQLSKVTTSFTENTVRKWKPSSDNGQFSVFVRLSGIYESGSKEYGSITLDLLLQAGVLVKYDDGHWDLAPDYSER
jgi:hypothetical protein